MKRKKSIFYSRNKLLLLTSLILSLGFTSAQVGINTNTPNATLDVRQGALINKAEGVLIPSFTVEDLAIKDSQYEESQHGVMVFITSGVGTSGKTKHIDGSGFYFYDSTIQLWNATGSREPWYSKTTETGATSNTDDIYQIGKVGIGSSALHASAQLDVNSTNRGILIPRLSKTDRTAIDQPANGLLIYNTSTNCFNYYNAENDKWLSMCGSYDPAQFNLISCTAPTGPAGEYKAGIPLNNSNTYTLSLNITEIGTYQILVTTGNGYSFSKSGTFTQTGKQDVVLEGQGTPINGPKTDTMSITFNGINVTPTCTLPSINVLGSTTSVLVNCGSSSLKGIYYDSTPLNATHYVDIPITSVITPGSIVIETATINGMKFSSGSITITPETTTIRLYGQGTPSAPGTITYPINISGSPTCTVSVLVHNSTGTFSKPANRCTDILSSSPQSIDGYYWIRDASGNKFKTYCDMSNGGWTLVKSLSEKQILEVEKTQSESIATQKARNTVTNEVGVFNEYAFSVPSAVVNNVGSSLGNKEFRFTIKEKGHQNSGIVTQEIVENTTIAPINDAWTKNNYWNVTIYNGNPATGNYVNKNNTTEGKLFGYDWGKKSASSGKYHINNIDFTYEPPGMYSSANFFTGFYGALGYAANNQPANNLTYKSSNGSQVTFNKYYINDLFGFYMNSESQLNHHIGTCRNSTDDYGGASFCSGGWANWRPHKFNNGEGRIIQYWVK